MGRRAARDGRGALGPSRLHDPRAHLLVGPARADRPGAEAPGGNPRPHALDPPAELSDPGGLDSGPWLPVLTHPSDRGRNLLPAIRPADQLYGTRVAPAEGEIDAHRAGRSLRDGRVHADRHGGRTSLLDEGPRADRRPAARDPDREREVVMDVLLLDSTTGFPTAVLFDNGYLTDLRTGAAGALAADLLARREVDRVGIIGVGTQARYQFAALLGVRKPERVIAFGRSEAKATRFAKDMEKLCGIRVFPAKTVEQAVRGSDVVITVTPSREPLVRAEWVSPGTHITAVGADGPDKQELDVGGLKNADKVVADRLDQCVRFREIHHAIEAGVLRPG